MSPDSRSLPIVSSSFPNLVRRSEELLSLVEAASAEVDDVEELDELDESAAAVESVVEDEPVVLDPSALVVLVDASVDVLESVLEVDDVELDVESVEELLPNSEFNNWLRVELSWLKWW